jgi:Polyketide cyclase / dehydrase and lipid transport
LANGRKHGKRRASHQGAARQDLRAAGRCRQTCQHRRFGVGESRFAANDSTVDGLGIRDGDAGRKETLFIPYRTTNTVVEYEPDQRIAWKTTAMGGLLGGRVWRYELSPADGGTLVRETWDVSADKQKPLITRGSVPKQTEDGMRATLERIAKLLES